MRRIIVLVVIISIICTGCFGGKTLSERAEKAKETVVKSDLRTYSIAVEQYLNENKGITETVIGGINENLDKTYKIIDITSESTPEGYKLGITKSTDPWSNNYEVVIYNNKVSIKTVGDNTNGEYKYEIIIKYLDGAVNSYTVGFADNIGNAGNQEIEVDREELNIKRDNKTEVNYNNGAPIESENEQVSSKDIEDVFVMVINKKNIPSDYDKFRFSERVEFTLSARNNTNKDIQGIQGVLEVQDLFGDKISRAQLNIVGEVIKPAETIIKEGMGFDVNQFIDEDVEIYNTDFKDLKFIYEVRKIVFADGTEKDY